MSERVSEMKRDQRQRGRFLGGKVPFGEAARDGERARADVLRDRLEATEAAAEVARRHAQEALDVAKALRQAEDAREGQGASGAAWGRVAGGVILHVLAVAWLSYRSFGAWQEREEKGEDSYRTALRQKRMLPGSSSSRCSGCSRRRLHLTALSPSYASVPRSLLRFYSTMRSSPRCGLQWLACRSRSGRGTA